MSDILSQSGFDWDNTKYMITVENEIAWNEYVKVVNHIFNFIYYSIVVIICVVINMFFFSSHMKRSNDFDSKSFLIGMIL